MVNIRKKKIVGGPQISGIIIAARWNEKGDVTGVTIQTHDENVYLVEPNEMGEELLNFVRRTVNVHGKVLRQPFGPHVIRVQSYELLAERLSG